MIGGGVLRMIGAHGAGWLFAGRLVVGLASGSAFSAGAAWIKELSADRRMRTRCRGRARGGPAGSAMTLGFALGPLVAGVLAQWAPLPGHASLPAAARAHGLRAGTGHTNPGDRAPEHRPAAPLPDGGGRCASAAWPSHGSCGSCCRSRRGVCASVAIAMVYVPGLVGQAPGIAVAFSAAVALCAALGGVAVQPLARRLASHDHPERPRLLIAGLTLVIAGLLAEAGIAALGQLGPWQPVLVLVLLAAAELGSDTASAWSSA